MKSYTIAAICILIAMFTGCQDVLDKHDLNVLDSKIWDDEAQATLYVNNLYETNMPDVSFGQNSQMTDETWSSETKYTDLLYGFKTSGDINTVTVLHKDKYELIRRINICLEGLESSSLPEDVKGELVAQALFFRAWRYWEMVQLYGGIPIITNVQDPYDNPELMNVPRSTTADAIDAIVADLDIAILNLPVEWTMDADKGRITSGAAAAFKGRILLSWASPLFNRNNDSERWTRAYNANKEAMDILALANRGLHPDFSTIFTEDVLNNVEAIFFRRYSLGAGNDYTHNWEGKVRPYSGGGSRAFSPTWELVKAFPMANGKLPGEPGSGYDSTYYWQNRDPRFYATVAYNGSEWSMSGRDQTNVWTFSPNSLESNRAPATGFYNKKATDPTIQRENVSQTNTAWLEIRYAEVMLNFAECANEIGETGEALDNVRAIRARAGIEEDDGSYGIANDISKESLREIIMVERQVEFAFENKRYWDLRRRLMYREDLGQYVKRINGTQRHGFTIRPLSGWNKEITDESSPYFGMLRIDTALIKGHLDLNDENSYKKFFRVTYRNLDISQGQSTLINYPELYDFFAIPTSILETSPAVEQTNGWLGGTFDPLAE